jgi:hypothetical protein
MSSVRARISAPIVAALLLATTSAAAAVELVVTDEPGSTDGAAAGVSDRALPVADAAETRRPVVRVQDAATTLVVDRAADPGALRRHPLVDRVEDHPSLDRWIVTSPSPARLARDLRAQHLEVDPVLVVRATDVLAPAPADPSDPYYPYHWGARMSELPYGLAAAGRPLQGPIVAVLDTGVAPHAELGDRLLPGLDLVSPGGDGRWDPHGHGTYTALTVAAAADDGLGSVGSCPGCRILPIRVLDAAGEGTSTAIADGIRSAVDLGADVINISAAGTRKGGSLSYEDSAVAYAAAAGVPILASAGNDGSTTLQYPAAIEGIIAVAGYDETGARASASSYGDWVDVAAPWCAVVGTSTGAGNYCGTSASAPFASGLVGLRRATVGTEPVTEVSSWLRAATRPVSWVAAGRLDACAVVREAPVRATLASLLEWTQGAAPSALSIDLAHPCGADHVRVEVAGHSSSRSLVRGVGRLSVASTPAFDLSAIPVGDHVLELTVTDALGRRTTDSHPLVVTEPVPAPVVLFTDVAVGSTHEAAIYWLADRGITRGCSPEGDRYCPAASVTRAQMASFLRSALALAPGPTDTYVDVSPGSTHAAAIGALWEAGITRGCAADGPRYCPSGSVTRAQMASFLTRGLDLPTPSDPTRFVDVPEGAPHADAVAALAAAGVTGGCSKDGTLFCPTAPVTRAQMATFLRNALAG